MALKTRITEMLEIEKPIIQAAMGWIARSQLSSAFSNAGGMGIIETSSGELDAVRAEILKMRDLTDKPFGVNVAQAFVRDPDIVQFVIDQGIKFVTTSAGNPKKYTSQLKEAGLTVFHVVPSLKAALGAIDVTVDGTDALVDNLLSFFGDRLKVHLRDEGARHDLIDAVFALDGQDDLLMVVKRVEALGNFVSSDDGANLLAGYKRAVNILKAEEKKDGPLRLEGTGLLRYVPDH